ncbi:UMP kinase [Candidatus Peregrinibacteria bacterium CG10_big_fil_rev_8_21_14_0_10_36_19]|nr:MAG: UMP kinase [Candidatus Peregrinibacteria bacterium CG10_big_fil_rev_8_21_14_0_10_36_19]
MKYKRILLKLSGEVFKGDLDFGFDGKILKGLAQEVKKVQKLGCQVAIVIGGGNIWRYRDFKHLTLPRVTSDTMGMLATVMNALAFESALNDEGVAARAMSSFPCESAVENYSIKKAKHHLNKGRVVIFAGGTGNPFFTTDSAAALRALEVDCDVLLKATKVDYVYDKDPVKHKDAKKFTKMSFQDVIVNGLEVMDLTCASLCESGNMPMLVFNLNKKGNIEKAVMGDKIGTIIN